MNMFSYGYHAIELFLRVLRTIDEDIVSRDEGNSGSVVMHRMRFVRRNEIWLIRSER